MTTYRTNARRNSAAIGIAMALLLSSPVTRASTYRVYTSSIPAMSLDANDGYCSLAEAVQHVNGTGNYNCPDFDPGSTQHRIELLQAPGKPHSRYHFNISTLTLSSRKRVSIAGSGAFIDSSGASAFAISAGASAFFDRLTLTNTAGIAGGRLLENYGTLELYNVVITRGDVTGNQHRTGRGGGIWNSGTIPFAQNVQITGNKAVRGGGIYNDAGIIRNMTGTISGNSALAGGGIFNVSTTPAPGPVTNGLIEDTYLTISGNSAKAGGGVFNRGSIDLTSSWITSNRAEGIGSGEPSCTGSRNCDGVGGGVLSVHNSGGFTRFGILGGAISNNVASRRGGAIYNVGVMNLAGIDMSSNRAADGAAIYVVSPTDGTGEYCNISGDDGNDSGPTQINNNIATSGYSIVAGGPLAEPRRCLFSGVKQGYVTATGNSPSYCQDLTVDVANSRCPQK